MAKIRKVSAREILDSRGFPTVEVDVELSDGSIGRAAVPSGASTGTHEALELRDGGPRYLGKGVLKAVKNIKALSSKVLGKSPEELPELDLAMIRLDGTPNKSKLGANAMLGVSMAVCRAGAAASGMPLYAYLRKVYGLKRSSWLLPAPMLNIINGGKHADSGIDVQEFMIVPVGAKNFSGAMRSACEIYQHLKKILAAEGHIVSVGDEGGFAPKIRTHEAVLQTIVKAIRAAGYKPGADVAIALDSAASEFFKDGDYDFEGKPLSSVEMTAVYEKWAANTRWFLLKIRWP
ncbi:MAG TPA: phosphopyruvate hydratase, partial [Elusimicrobiales bacterium]|nr:phosphopyruvate hydratase [Elusimicrobiales bacterium]